MNEMLCSRVFFSFTFLFLAHTGIPGPGFYGTDHASAEHRTEPVRGQRKGGRKKGWKDGRMEGWRGRMEQLN